jgi:hypothetical protein
MDREFNRSDVDLQGWSESAPVLRPETLGEIAEICPSIVNGLLPVRPASVRIGPQVHERVLLLDSTIAALALGATLATAGIAEVDLRGVVSIAASPHRIPAGLATRIYMLKEMSAGSGQCELTDVTGEARRCAAGLFIDFLEVPADLLTSDTLTVGPPTATTRDTRLITSSPYEIGLFRRH